jgi:hypothetical protein
LIYCIITNKAAVSVQGEAIDLISKGRGAKVNGRASETVPDRNGEILAVVAVGGEFDFHDMITS